MKKSPLACLSVFFSASFVLAQSNHYFSKSYTTENGLPQNSIINITKDKNGFFWLTTDGGIARWDGANFKKNEVYGTSVNLPPVFKSSPDGNLYLAVSKNKYFLIDENSALKPYNSDKFEYLKYGDVVKLNSSVLKELNEKYSYSINRKNTTTNSDTTAEAIYSIDSARFYIIKYNVIFYVNKNQITILRKSGVKDVPLFFDKKLIFLQQNGKYEIFSGANLIKEGVHRFKPKQYKEIPHLFWYFQNVNNGCFVGYKNSICYLNIDAANNLQEAPYFSLSNYTSIQSFYCNYESGLVITGSYNNGFTVYKPKLFHQANIDKNNERNIVYSQLTFDNKTVITDQKIFDNIIPLNRQKRWDSRNTGAALKITNHEAIITNDAFLFLFNQQLKLLKKWPITHHASSFFVTDSIIYFANKRLGKINLKTKQVNELKLSDWPCDGETIRFITRSYNADYTFAAIGNSIYELNFSAHTKRKYSAFNYQTTKLIRGRNIYVDTSLHALFIPEFQKGLTLCLSNEQLIPLPLDKEKIISTCNSFLIDKDGDYWISTNQGIFMLFKTDLLNFISGKSTVLNFKKYGTDQGLVNEEFNGAYTGSGILLGDSLVFASMAGAVIFHPKIKYLNLQPDINVVIDKLAIDGVTEKQISTLTLSPDFRLLEINLAYPSIENKNIILEYSIEGSNDSSWLPVANTGNLVIKNLHPGNYIVKVRIASSSKNFLIAFNVKQYWYKTPFAITVWVLSGVLIIFLLLRWRVNYVRSQLKADQLLTEEKLRSLRSQINPHFIQNALAFLAMKISSTDATKNQITANFIHNLSSYFRNILKESNKSFTTFEDELILIEKYLTIQKEAYPIKFSYQINVAEDADIFGVTIPSMLLQPFVENCLKHAFTHQSIHPFIIITVTHENDNYLVCNIKDNGKGIQPKFEQSDSMGNTITLTRLELAYKKYKRKPVVIINSTPNVGTEVILKFPLI
jgi:hypothetical protein